MHWSRVRLGLAIAVVGAGGCASGGTDDGMFVTLGAAETSGGDVTDGVDGSEVGDGTEGDTSGDDDDDTDDDDDDDDTEDDGATDDTAGDPCGGMVCDTNASCVDEVCTCDEGWVGDGATCSDADGCTGNPCFAGVQCTDEPAPGTGFSCGACPDGYEGDGQICSDADGCAANPCFAGVMCSDVPAPGTGFSCGSCPAGYEGDGQACDDIDGCAGGPCYPAVMCSDVPAPNDGFTCGSCPAGLYGDGIACITPTDSEVGGLSNSANLGPYFRANGYVADADGVLVDFEVYLGNATGCSLDFYVFEAALPDGALTQVWRNTVVGAGTGYQVSGLVDIDVTSGTYYALGVGWNCTLTYYWESSGGSIGADAGIGTFSNNRWDNSYPGASDFYVPPNVGAASTSYPQRVSWVEL